MQTRTFTAIAHEIPRAKALGMSLAVVCKVDDLFVVIVAGDQQQAYLRDDQREAPFR